MKRKIIITLAILVTQALTYHHGWPPSYSTYDQYQHSWDWYNQFYHNQNQQLSQQNIVLVQNPYEQWNWNYPEAYNPQQTWTQHPEQIIKNAQQSWYQDNAQFNYPSQNGNPNNEQFNINSPQQNWYWNNEQNINDNPQQLGNENNEQLNKGPQETNNQNITPSIEESSKPSLDNFFEQLNRNLENDTQKPLKPAPMYNITNNPCEKRIVNTPPDFKRLGRRISQMKCLEYIWDIRKSHLEDKQRKDCSQYRKDINATELDVLVIGGRVAEAGEFPHMVALGWKTIDGNWVFKCGGTIISPKFVVTAAHCQKIARNSNIPNPQPEIVRLGAKNLDEVQNENTTVWYPVDINIVRFIPHPNYASPSQYFDIALIELNSPILRFNDNIRAACLWNNLDTSPLGTMVSASGWGVTEINGRMSTTELRVGDIELIDTNTCSRLVKCGRNFCGLRDHQVCAGKLEGGVDTCQGDSGGPLQVPIKLPSALKRKIYYLVGITSVGQKCALANSPGVYTRVASFTDWIESIVWKDELAGGQ